MRSSRDPIGFPGGRSYIAITSATSPSGLPRCLHFRYGFVINGRRAYAFREGFPGCIGVVGGFQAAGAAGRCHGERIAAVAGPVHPAGHQFDGHRRAVLHIPAEGPGRPRAQGQCGSPRGLTGRGGSRGVPRTRGREGTPATLCSEAARPRRSEALGVTLNVSERHRFVLKLFLEKVLCTR